MKRERLAQRPSTSDSVFILHVRGWKVMGQFLQKKKNILKCSSVTPAEVDFTAHPGCPAARAPASPLHHNGAVSRWIEGPCNE